MQDVSKYCKAKLYNTCGLSYSNTPVYSEVSGSYRNSPQRLTRQTHPLCSNGSLRQGQCQMWDDTEAEDDSIQCRMTDGRMTEC